MALKSDIWWHLFYYFPKLNTGLPPGLLDNVADQTFNVPGLAYDVQGLTSEVPGLRPGQTRPNLSPAPKTICTATSAPPALENGYAWGTEDVLKVSQVSHTANTRYNALHCSADSVTTQYVNQFRDILNVYCCHFCRPTHVVQSAVLLS